jgi:hypothetical protein
MRVVAVAVESLDERLLTASIDPTRQARSVVSVAARDLWWWRVGLAARTFFSGSSIKSRQYFL